MFDEENEEKEIHQIGFNKWKKIVSDLMSIEILKLKIYKESLEELEKKKKKDVGDKRLKDYLIKQIEKTKISIYEMAVQMDLASQYKDKLDFLVDEDGNPYIRYNFRKVLNLGSSANNKNDKNSSSIYL